MKSVNINMNRIPNFLMHSLLAFELEPRFSDVINPNYKETYSSWATKAEKEQLRNLAFSVEGVSSNVKFATLYQIPAYFSDDNIDNLTATIEKLATHDLLSFLDYYPDKKETILQYVPLDKIPLIFGKELTQPNKFEADLLVYADLLPKLYERNFKDNWRTIKSNMGEVRKDISEYFTSKDNWIERWEDITTLDFPYESFDVELIDSLATLGTSILAERDGFYAYAPPKLLIAMISHEIGTHILFNSYTLENCGILPLVEKNIETFFKANELLAWSLNMDLMKELNFSSERYERNFSFLEPMRTQIKKIVSGTAIEDLSTLFKKAFSIMDAGLKNLEK